jgi:hypothetical protein
MDISSSDAGRSPYAERATLPPIGTLALVMLASLSLWGAIGYAVAALFALW